MSLGDLTKQLASEALGNPVKTVLDALRPADISRISDTVRNTKPAGPPSGESLAATVVGQVQAMQKAAKDDEELVVLLHTGEETVRVLEVFLPSWQVMVLTGIDTEKNITRVIAPVETLQLVCKLMKVAAPGKPVRIGFIAPRPKSE